MPTLEARLRWYPRRALDLLRQDRRLRRAARVIPRPMPWEWARPRLVPLLAGPYLGPQRLVTTVADIGCAVIYGIEVEGTCLTVDHDLLQRWETSVSQLTETAMSNLEVRAAGVSAADVRHGTLSGRLVRLLDGAPWSTSLLLAPDHLVRVFGDEDQVFATPRREVLLAFPADIPVSVAAHIAIEFEANSAYPLMLDPFALIGGKLVWETPRDGDEPDDW